MFVKAARHHCIEGDWMADRRYPSCELRPHSNQTYLLVPSPQSPYYQNSADNHQSSPRLFPWLGREAQIVRVGTNSLDMRIMSPPLASVLEFKRMR